MARAWRVARGLALLCLASCAPTEPSAASAPAVATSSAPPASARASASAPTAGEASASAPASSAPRADEPPAKKKRVYALAAIGDSLTDEKVGGGKFLPMLRKRCPESRFDSFGKGGNMVNQMRKRFRAEVYGEGEASPPKQGPYTHVLVFGGVNDMYSDKTAGRTAKKVEADLALMYGWARERGAAVIAVTIAPWGGFKPWWNGTRGARTREVNRWIFEQQKAGAVAHVLDAFSLLSCGVPDVLCHRLNTSPGDGLHFNEAGHAILAEALHTQVFHDCR